MLFDLQYALPLFIPLLALFIPIVAILAHYIGKAHTERQRHETIRELARAGQPIPPELLGEAQDSDWHRARRDQANPNEWPSPAIGASAPQAEAHTAPPGGPDQTQQRTAGGLS